MTSPVKMEFPAQTATTSQYTILRIKRKRNEEPLDALGELQLVSLRHRTNPELLLLSR